MDLIRRRFVALWAMASAAIAAAQEPVIITAGPSTFGPPTGAPAPLKNGQCPICRFQNEDNITQYPPGAVVKYADAQFLVGCTKCNAAFWQRMKAP